MGFREVSVIEIREVLRLWLRGESGREIERLTRVDRRTTASYVSAAEMAGLSRGSDESQLTEELLGEVILVARPSRPDGHGEMWRLCERERDFLEPLVKRKTLRLTKIHDLLRRRTGVEVPYATLHRYATAELGFGRRRGTVPLTDGEPGKELQVDFGRMGLLLDPITERRRVCYALIFTAVFSRHTFLWLTFQQTLRAVICGFEAAWSFFEGVFAVVIPDNMKAIVDKPDRLAPRINLGFLEYAQSRGFVIDPARVGTPTDKARVERTVQYARGSFFQGEDFRDIDDAQNRAPMWCRDVAGMRIHRSTQRRPLELFVAEERPRLLPAPAELYDVPTYRTARVARDFHVEVDKQLYSVPYGLVGCWVDVRADSQLVRISYRGELVKCHPRATGRRQTDRADMPPEKSDYALRDIDSLQRKAAAHGPAIGIYAARLLDTPLPWTRMRAVYGLLALVGRYGPHRVDAACDTALQIDVVDVTRIKRMLERGLDSTPTQNTARSSERGAQIVDLRYARDVREFRMGEPS